MESLLTNVFDIYPGVLVIYPGVICSIPHLNDNKITSWVFFDNKT